MSRVNEQKLENVDDSNSPVVEALKRKRRKFSIIDLRSEIRSFSIEYTFISYAFKEIIAHVSKDYNTSIEYFRLYITKTHSTLIAKHINLHAVVEIIKQTFEKKSRFRLWINIDADHISQFISIFLAMNLANMSNYESY